MANGPREEQCPYTCDTSFLLFVRSKYYLVWQLVIHRYSFASKNPSSTTTLLRSCTSTCSLAPSFLSKLDGLAGLAPAPIGVWEARQRYLQLASIYWSLFPITTWFASTKPTATTEQTGLCSPYRAHNCLHGLPPAHVLRSTTQCWSHFSILSNTTYKSYLNLEIHPFTASKVVIQYHALPICRDHCQSAPNGGIYFGRDVKLHQQTAWRSRRARRGDCFH
jgi:hypothetical protein